MLNNFSKYRSKLLEKMIHIFGFEHSQVIYFCKACETLPKGFHSYRLLKNWVRTVDTLQKSVGFELE